RGLRRLRRSRDRGAAGRQPAGAAAHPQCADTPDEGPRLRPRLPVRARLRRADRGDGVPPRGVGRAAVLRAEGRGRGTHYARAAGDDAEGAEEVLIGFGRPFSPICTYTTCASVTVTRSRASPRIASTVTLVVIEVVPTRSASVQKLTRSPTCTG